jgi:hypothetical protein
MENISIESLCPNGKKPMNNKCEIFCVSNFVNIDNEEKPFDAEKLIRVRKNKRKKLLDNYVKIYNKCLENIETVNSLSETHLYFEVPSELIECYGYNSNDCVEYIENKLRNQYIDTLKISKSTLYVSWLYIELNKERA